MKANIQKLVDETKRIVKKKDAEIALLKSKLTAANGERSVVFKMPDELTVANFPKLTKVEITNQQKEMGVHILNLKDFPKIKFPEVQDVRILNHQQTPEVQKVEMVNAEKASSWVPSLVQLAAEKIMGGFGKIIAKGVEVRLAAGERLKPQTVVIVDIDGNPVDMKPRKGGNHGAMPFPLISRGNVTTIANNCVSGRIVISNPGTPVQLPNVGCKRVVFTTLSGNSGIIAIGGKTVSAQSGSESGSIILPTGSASIDVFSANVLFVDGSNSGDVVAYNILS